MSYLVLAQSHHPLGGFFLAQQDDSTLLAGRDEASARPYADAQALYDNMYEFAMRGHHWAWNLCYEAQTFVS